MAIMRILFFMRHAGYVRNFEWALRELAARGHRVTIIFDSKKSGTNEKAAYAQLDAIRAESPKLEFGELVPPKASSLLVVAARRLRLIQDYVRYLDPVFASATKLRRRSALYLDGFSRRVVDIICRVPGGRNGLLRVLHWFDQQIPYPSAIRDRLRAVKPDLMMVTPLFGHGSNQGDYFKAARELGIRSCLPVTSWDNLTSKGVAHADPDRILVWNDAQKQEAIELQQFPAERVLVTGAHSYDHWFDWQPSTTREAFLSKLGLAPELPYLLFLGSSNFIAPNEHVVAMKWAKALRESGDPALRSVGILIRPHPQNAQGWSETDVSFLGNVAIHPKGGSNPVSRSARDEFFDSMYFCRLVVGVNTSALIEAGILGKPVHTALFDELAETQEGTLHFQHLAAGEGGLLNVSQSLDEHIAKLALALRRASDEASRSRVFVERFVRPPNLPKAPSKIFADLIEEQAQSPLPQPVPVTPARRLLRLALSPLLLLCVPEYLFSAAQVAMRSSKRRTKKKNPARVKSVKQRADAAPGKPQSAAVAHLDGAPASLSNSADSRSI